mmetsp:Transcript_66655/g.138952  ORF Transcript_66655/g.138952 Transcript_66655/m.138952 type:complete len:226 (+) Transcript_66655:391-1068(+)
MRLRRRWPQRSKEDSEGDHKPPNAPSATSSPIPLSTYVLTCPFRTTSIRASCELDHAKPILRRGAHIGCQGRAANASSAVFQPRSWLGEGTKRNGAVGARANIRAARHACGASNADEGDCLGDFARRNELVGPESERCHGAAQEKETAAHCRKLQLRHPSRRTRPLRVPWEQHCDDFNWRTFSVRRPNRKRAVRRRGPGRDRKSEGRGALQWKDAAATAAGGGLR